VARIPQRGIPWLAALAAAAGHEGWATAAQVVAALRETNGANGATSSAAASNLRRFLASGLVEVRRGHNRREWKLSQSGWAFVQSD
jgi:hypothetical protein